MMRKSNLVLVVMSLLVLVFPVSALIAGSENVVMSFDECTDLFVNVSGSLPIDPDEYFFVNCEEVGVDEWYCDCYDGYDLVIDLHVAAYNDYVFDIRYYYGEHVPRDIVRRSSRTVFVEIEETETEEPEVPVEPPVRPPVDPEPEVIYINDTITIVEPCDNCTFGDPVVSGEKSAPWWSVALWLLFILFVAWWFLFKKKSGKQEKA